MVNLRNDEHLDTGKYDPERYWSARANASDESLYRTVCVYKALDIENKTADRIQRKLFGEALARLPVTPRQCLEYGCGAGRWGRFFIDRKIGWSGVDISQSMLDRASKAHPDTTFRKIENNTIPFASNSFDLVYTITVLHHNPPEAQQAILRELCRVTRPGGYFIAHEDLRTSAKSFNMFPREITDWVSTIEDAGFRYTWSTGGRYWIIKNLCSLFLGRAVNLPVLRCIIGYLDYHASPVLQKFIPARWHRFAIMLFAKPDQER